MHENLAHLQGLDSRLDLYFNFVVRVGIYYTFLPESGRPYFSQGIISGTMRALVLSQKNVQLSHEFDGHRLGDSAHQVTECTLSVPHL